MGLTKRKIQAAREMEPKTPDRASWSERGYISHPTTSSNMEGCVDRWEMRIVTIARTGRKPCDVHVIQICAAPTKYTTIQDDTSTVLYLQGGAAARTPYYGATYRARFVGVGGGQR